MLTRTTIIETLPLDVLRLAMWWTELRVEMHAALAVMPPVTNRADREEVIPSYLTRAMRCDEACAWLARRMELWPPPIDWPRSWWLVYAGAEASGRVDDEPVTTVRKVGRK